MPVRIVRIPVEMVRHFSDELLMVIDDDYFPLGILATKMIAEIAPELYKSLARAELDLLIVPSVKEMQG